MVPGASGSANMAEAADHHHANPEIAGAESHDDGGDADNSTCANNATSTNTSESGRLTLSSHSTSARVPMFSNFSISQGRSDKLWQKLTLIPKPGNSVLLLILKDWLNRELRALWRYKWRLFWCALILPYYFGAIVAQNVASADHRPIAWYCEKQFTELIYGRESAEWRSSVEDDPLRRLSGRESSDSRLVSGGSSDNANDANNDSGRQLSNTNSTAAISSTTLVSPFTPTNLFATFRERHGTLEHFHLRDRGLSLVSYWEDAWMFNELLIWIFNAMLIVASSIWALTDRRLTCWGMLAGRGAPLFAVGHFIRMSMIYGTSLPSPTARKDYCRKIRSSGEGGRDRAFGDSLGTFREYDTSCGDLMYSGHWLMMCMIIIFLHFYTWWVLFWTPNQERPWVFVGKFIVNVDGKTQSRLPVGNTDSSSGKKESTKKTLTRDNATQTQESVTMLRGAAQVDADIVIEEGLSAVAVQASAKNESGASKSSSGSRSGNTVVDSDVVNVTISGDEAEGADNFSHTNNTNSTAKFCNYFAGPAPLTANHDSNSETNINESNHNLKFVNESSDKLDEIRLKVSSDGTNMASDNVNATSISKDSNSTKYALFAFVTVYSIAEIVGQFWLMMAGRSHYTVDCVVATWTAIFMCYSWFRTPRLCDEPFW